MLLKGVLVSIVACCLADSSSTVSPNFERIIGGADAKDGAAPYVVALYNDGNFICGGSIIGDRWILTAAHCVEGLVPRKSHIVAGTTNLKRNGSLHHIDRSILHEGYDPNHLRDDVGLLRLATPLAFCKRIKKIDLSDERVPISANLSLAGWGIIGRNGETTNRLQTITLRNIGLNQCRQMYASSSLISFISYDSNLCTFTKKNEGACGGDSGSPLIWNGKQVAIVSWNRECANGYPDVHTRVSYHYDWIRQTIAENSE